MSATEKGSAGSTELSAKELSTLAAKARGGRVVRTHFVDAAAIDRRLLDDPEIRFRIDGGFADANQVILTLYPAQIPEVESPVQLLTVQVQAPEWEAQDLRVALGRLSADGKLPANSLGDVRGQAGTFQVAALTKAAATLLETTELSGRNVEITEGAAGEGRGSRLREVVVPSMRCDVVGAKGFGVSRAYFQQGIDAGKVRLNGQVARAGTAINEGDSLSAQGLGRIDFKRVLNETRRGNFKVELEVHK